MRKNILGALIASAFALGGTAHAGLVLDLNGAAAGGVIIADALDWAPTSFLARGGNTAIAAFAGTGGACALVGANCTFEVLTHARLSGYSPSSGGGFIGLPTGVGEINLVARYTETVVGFNPAGPGNPFTNASFVSTGAGSAEFYYSAGIDSVDLTGTGFNNGRLIGRLDGVNAGAAGAFFITGGPVALDQATAPPAPTNNYPGQSTVTGFGSQSTLDAGTTGVDLDPTFFLSANFKLNFQNISISLPYLSVNPSDCFNDPIAGRLVGSVGNTSTCDATHVLGPYSAQAAAPGYRPVVGATNGLGLTSPDFVAQTDFNSAVQGTVPEPGSLALVGLALGSLSFVAARRRRRS